MTALPYSAKGTKGTKRRESPVRRDRQRERQTDRQREKQKGERGEREKK